MHCRTAQRAHGVTLIELMCCLAVAAVLAAVAAPSFGRLIAHTAVIGAQNDLATAFHQARLSAVETERTTLICPSTDGLHCSHSIHWGQGWLVAYDRDRDGKPDGPVISVGRVEGNAAVLGSKGRLKVHFRPDGGAPGSNLSLVVCAPGKPGAGGSGIVVSNVGRIRLGHPDKDAVKRCANGG